MPQNNFSYEFENHRVDVDQRVLTRDGESIPLTPKATDVLLILLDKAGQLVEKDFLLNQIWPDSFVEENNLTQCVFVLRRALQEDSSGPKFIETVARRGFRFVAPVKKIPAPTIAAEQEPFTIPSRLPVLAVLKFINATGDVELQYLAEGIPETLINSFSGLSQLRVISRSTAFRYKSKQVDLQATGHKLGADVLLVGQIATRESALSVSVELVGVNSGWQLWGETFLVDSSNIFEIQDEITRQILRALNLPLSGEEEKRVAKRYTENVAAYQTYLEGRYHWSRYSRTGIERAIGHFGKAIELDSNYALAYAGIVDCYLRLATNYLPPEDGVPLTDEPEPDGLMEDRNPAASAPDVEHDLSSAGGSTSKRADSIEQAAGELLTDGKVKLRHEWDWKGAERELRRANELRTDYPAAHQWHAGYQFSRKLAEQSCGVTFPRVFSFEHFRSDALPPVEEIQILCTIAREQMEVGNYQAGCLALQNWWTIGQWPELDQLTAYSAADLLFTAGTLADCMASTGQFAMGHKHSEALLNGSLALCDLLGLKTRASEVRAELGACYYRQGFFDLARSTLQQSLDTLSNQHQDLKSLCLFRLAVVDRHAGRLQDSLDRLRETAEAVNSAGPWIRGRYHQEFGTTQRDLAAADGRPAYFERALENFKRALYEFEAVGNHRYVAAVLNNIGFVLLALDRLSESETYLYRARSLFSKFGDQVRCSQVDETLAQLYLAEGRFESADERIVRALSVLEKADEEALLAEALITQGRVLIRLDRPSEAKAAFDGAHRIAERRGHYEGAGLALLVMLEELPHYLLPSEKTVFFNKMERLLANSQQISIKDRIKNCRN